MSSFADSVVTLLTVLSVALGAGFFTAGTVGLLRFPDLRSRLHAVTKADTLGLGFVMLALALQADSGWTAAKYGLVWVVGMLAAAVAATLLAADPDVDGALAPEGGIE